MFGRSTRLIALAAMVTHLWVNLIVAPWHHLVEHRLSAVATEAGSGSIQLKSSKCQCRHHAHPECDDTASADPSKKLPSAPHHDAENCQVCHVLAQAFLSTAHPTLEAAPERVEFMPPESVVQLSLEPTRDPASRGPPTA